MKKRHTFLLCAVLLLVSLLAACGKTDPTKSDYGGKSYAELQTESSALIDSITAMDEDTMRYYIEQGDALSSSILGSWLDNSEGLGDYESYDGFTVTKSGKTVTTDMTVHFANRDAIFEVAYSTIDMSVPEGASLNPIQTMGEKMSRAGMNTIISLLIVFTVLILICLVIYCFKLVPYLEQKQKEKEQQRAVPENAVVEQIREREELTGAARAENDTQLAAVIAAAIAAFEGTSADQFVVRSIRRRS